MKYLYLVNYNQPFPSSEYGGLIAVIAGDDNECHSILLDSDLWNEKYVSLIMQAVVNAQKYTLSGDPKSGIQEAFTT